MCVRCCVYVYVCVCMRACAFIRSRSDIVGGVEQLLQHVSSVKALASIKTAVHSLVGMSPVPAPEDSNLGDSTHNAGGRTHWAERWSEVCTLILNKEFNVWGSFLGPTLLKRVQVSGKISSGCEQTLWSSEVTFMSMCNSLGIEH